MWAWLLTPSSLSSTSNLQPRWHPEISGIWKQSGWALDETVYCICRNPQKRKKREHSVEYKYNDRTERESEEK